MTAAERLTLSQAEIRALDRDLDRLAAESPAGWLKPGVSSPGGVAVAGHDGFLFIGDGANRWERQYRQTEPMDADWLATWAAVFAARQAEAGARGVPLVNLVIPEKQVVYPEKRWATDTPRGDQRPLRQLARRLGPEARLVYPLGALLACREEGPAYPRRNSHWTASGCVAVTHAVLAQAAPEVELTALRFTGERDVQPHDLTPHLFDPPPLDAVFWLVTPGEKTFDNEHMQRTGQQRGTIYVLEHAAAPDPRTVIVFGDSYSYNLGFTGALSAVFRKVVFVWSKNVVWDLVDRQEAGLVVWQSAERFLATTSRA
ncbi:alginate O-acetyltransferase AlgX-related protein [Phenylobacterium sp.]|uniref:alginate O-acetyltransferase AlgX-related protein n=1 Tax=Phenylobacterium sp. TaxID=1871053 RepID=UPI002F94B1BA